MEALPDYTKCPRCECSVLIWPQGADEPVNGARSRATRDDGATVIVCKQCGEKEALKQALHGGALGALIPLVDWPLSLEDLASEDQLWRMVSRGSVLTVASLDDIESEQ